MLSAVHFAFVEEIASGSEHTLVGKHLLFTFFPVCKLEEHALECKFCFRYSCLLKRTKLKKECSGFDGKYFKCSLSIQ